MTFLSNVYWKRQFEHIEALIKTSYTNIMSAMSDFKDQLTEFHDKISSGLDSIATDIQTLKDAVAAGTITPEQQQAILAKFSALVDKVEALDSLVTNEAPEPPTTT